MKFVAHIALSLAFLAGCSSHHEVSVGAEGAGQTLGSGTSAPGPRVPAEVSGTRLRAKNVVTADGVRSFVGWFDAQLGEDCSFDRAEDGKMRCLPNAVPENFGGFADAACSMAVIRAPVGTGCVAPTAAFQYVAASGACAASARQLHALKRIENGGKVYNFSPGSGSCVPTTVTAADTYYSVGSTLPASSFVEGTEVTDPGEGLVETHLDTSDGARHHAGWQIGQLDAECAFEIMADGVARCVPTNGATGSEFYLNSSCSIVAGASIDGYAGPCGGTRPTIWLRREASNGTCDRTVAAFTLGSPTSVAQQIYKKSNPGGFCYSPGSSGVSYFRGYQLDEEITTTLPTVTRVGEGTARLVPALVFAAGARTLVPGWRDTVRNEDCTFALASDGKTRCLPVASRATVLFKDGACKGERVAGLDEASCGTDKPTVALAPSADACAPQTKVFSLGAKLDLASASQETGGGRCVGIAGARNVFAATEIDPTSYVEGTLTKD